ncbi:MAG: hypothetical protein K2K37_05345, partial [Muribaculaceae bacterium]|nr:hypothetical protein [Muribaculaceae bacterium]
MNSIISLPRLIDLLSRASSKDKAICEDFIRCFAGGVGDALGKNGNVRIKGFGMFNVVSSGGVRRIVFIPDRELADAVNAPFACFEPVELAPGVSEDVLAAADDAMTDTVTGNIIYESETEIVSETIYDQVEHSPESPDDASPDDASPDEEPSVSSCADSPSVVSDGVPDDASASVPKADAPADQSESGEDDVVGHSGTIEMDLSVPVPERVSSDNAEDTIANSRQTSEDASGDLVVDFGFDISVDIPGDEPAEAAESDSPITEESLEGEVPEATSFIDSVELSDTDPDVDDAHDSLSDEDADQNSSVDLNVSDEIEDLPPTPWAGKTKEEDAFMDTTGLGLLTPEARQRMLDRQSKNSDKERSGTSPWFWIAIAYIGGMAIGFMLGFFGHDYLKGLSDRDKTIDLSDAPAPSATEDEVIDLTQEDENLIGTQDVNLEQMPDSAILKSQTDSVSSARTDSVTAPHLGQPPVYDTITPNRNLNTLALKHYGNKVYWVYIFLDNQDK